MKTNSRLRIILSTSTGIILLTALMWNVPPVQSRLAWRIDDLRTRIKYLFSPPEEAVFQPGEHVMLETPVSTSPSEQTIAARTRTPIPSSVGLSPVPTTTPKPLPASVELSGFIYADQNERWNYCGPATLAMALNFWGWKGSRDDIARVVKPGIQDSSLDFIQRGRWDKNVMLYELAGFVQNHTDFKAVVRYGGEIDLVKQLVANGFPVVIEKGYYERDYAGKVGWMGHYAFITGYDERAGVFIYQETYPPKGKRGENWTVQYDVFREGWRGFNYLFMVVYPREREADVLDVLGPWRAPTWADEHALEIAEAESQTLKGIDGFFAWFNKGTSLVALKQYSDAATAYDQAFSAYAALSQGDTQRPYRTMWYQTGPYEAYYFSSRYEDVVALANTTLNETIAEPTLEESLYWRGLAQYALGDRQAAVADLQEAVRLNPNFQPGIEKLQDWNVDP